MSGATGRERSSGTPAHVTLGPGAEFDLVRRLERRWGARAAGLGDDCAVLGVPPGERLVASTDLSVEEVHFRRGWLRPREIGWRATAAALSDLAAMAARPLGVLVAMTVPDGWRADVDELAEGIGEAAEYAGATIVGGDTSGGERLSLAVTVLGTAAHPLGRDGVRPGDRIYVTGALGGPGAALRDLLRGDEPSSHGRARFARPEPRVREAIWLRERGARAAIDVSDGLAADAAHLASASAVRIRIDLERVPVLEELDPRTGAWAADERGARLPEVLLEAAASGEEYELIVAAPDALDANAFVSRFGVRLTEIGRAEELADGETPEVATHLDGARVDPPGGHDHFSS